VCARRSGERLTVNVKEKSYLQLLEMYKYHIIALQNAPGGAFGPNERSALAQLIWRMARNAARAHNTDIASNLFNLATELSGKNTRVGSPPALLLYNILSPIRAEQIIDTAKMVVYRAKLL